MRKKIVAGNWKMNTTLQEGVALAEGLKEALAGKTVNRLMNAEADSTRVALADYERPRVTISIPKVDAYNLGQLLYMFEVQTAIAGALYNINTFNQPGVEQAKNYTYALMGRAGSEESANMLQERMITV